MPRSAESERPTYFLFDYDAANGRLAPRQTISSLPPGFAGSSFASEIMLSAGGRFVYAGNRLHDSIAIFSIDQRSCELTPVGWEPTGGRTPRYFGLEPGGAHLYAANHNSDTVVIFRVDQASGTLTPTKQVVNVVSPSTIVFA